MRGSQLSYAGLPCSVGGFVVGDGFIRHGDEALRARFHVVGSPCAAGGGYGIESV